MRRPPAHVRSDKGPAFIAAAVQQWLAKTGVKTLYATSGSPSKNGYRETFDGSLCDELRGIEIFDLLAEARSLIKAWRRHYNGIRPPRSAGAGLPTVI